MVIENLDPWALETEEDSTSVPSDMLNAENITSETPKSEHDTLLWLAVKEMIAVSKNKTEVMQKVKKWNRSNEPRIPDRDLSQKTRWALKKWDYQFGSSNSVE